MRYIHRELEKQIVRALRTFPGVRAWAWQDFVGHL